MNFDKQLDMISSFDNLCSNFLEDFLRGEKNAEFDITGEGKRAF